LSRITSGFFRLFFKGIFYKILVKIYYSVFRLKKSELTNKTIRELIQNQLAYLFILALTVGFVGFNVVSPDKPGALETQISKTVMAQLIPAEFDSMPNEQLIEEIQTPAGISPAAPEKYSDTSCVLDKATNILIEEETEQGNLLSFNDSGDVVFKPRITATTAGDAGVALAQRTTITYYTVQNGDVVSTIARRFGLTVNTILWANNLTAYSLIRPGDKLTILPYSGVLYTVKSGDTVSKIASKYGVDGDKILSCNDLVAGLKAGQTIVIPGAKKIATQTSVARTTNNSGLSIINNLIKTPAAKISGNKMAWPTIGSRITQYFSWRHTGVDIANKIGTPIYAADDGVVEIARGGYNGGYGNTIVINHGGGIKTRYGHASKLFVKAGDEVEKGENIAAMGSTGRSTGPHLHFEVLINGTRYNPLNYIR
jgi:murein DD-endopeptidase MepM/ murein hydrolase activator NlpD